MTGLDIVAAQAAASKEEPIAAFEPLRSSALGFASIEHRTIIPFFAIAGKPRTEEEGTAVIRLCNRAVRVTDEVGVQAVMVAI